MAMARCECVTLLLFDKFFVTCGTHSEADHKSITKAVQVLKFLGEPLLNCDIEVVDVIMLLMLLILQAYSFSKENYKGLDMNFCYVTPFNFEYFIKQKHTQPKCQKDALSPDAQLRTQLRSHGH